MRGLRTTLLLAVALIGLGAYIYFVESKREPEAADKKEKVFDVAADKIEEIRIKPASGDASALKKSGDTWNLTEPDAAKADQGEVSGITSNLGSLEIQRVVDEEGADLAAFGLAQPRIEVQFKAAGDQAPRRLLIGEKTSTGGDLYAKRGDDKKVFLIPAFVEGTLNRTPFDLRDKAALAFDRDKIDFIEIKSPETTIELAKVDGNWRVKKPYEGKADYGAVEALIGRLAGLQMKSLEASGDIVDPKSYGLAAPAYTVTIGAGSTRAALAIGTAKQGATDPQLFARDLSRPVIFTVEQTVTDDLKKAPAEYRRKDLFEFRSFNATRLEINRAGQVAAFEKSKVTGATATTAEEKWKQVLPAARDVDQTKMDDLLSKLSNLRAQSFVNGETKTGLYEPAVTVVAKYDEGKKEERTVFSRVGTDVYAGRTGEPGAASVAPVDFDNAMKALDEVLSAPAPTPEKKEEKK